MQKKVKWQELPFDDLLRLSAEKQYGAILRYYRVKMGWKAWELAMLYGEAVRGEQIEDDVEAVAENWIYMMERQNMVPQDEKRRWILARLLDIPPLLFGLGMLEGAGAVAQIFQWERVDVKEYRATLEQYCDSYHLGNILQLLHDIKGRITNLQNEIHYSSSQEKQQMAELLCGYLILAAIIVREHQNFDTAIELLTRAIIVAEGAKLYTMWAEALRQRGVIYLARGETAAFLHGIIVAQHDLDSALHDYAVAHQLTPHLSPLYQGSIFIDVGAAYASAAQDRQALRNALKIIDQGSTHIGKAADEKRFLARPDREQWHLKMAEAYLAAPLKDLCSPDLAREQLEQAAGASSFPSKPRQARNALLLAKSYFLDGDYPMATAYTGAAIDGMQGSISPRYLARLEYLYQGLRASSYGKHTDVASLSVKLLRVQKPELFT
jgi:tetratricopeptide (TPR) repeat protein